MLKVDGAEGDANLRSFMNWDELAANAPRAGYRVGDVHDYWARLGRFRHAHIAVGAGVHQMIAASPYTFKRTYDKDGVRDRVVIALELPRDRTLPISVAGVFMDGQTVYERFSGQSGVVTNGRVQFAMPVPVALISQD
jgi:alpha-amylase